METQLGTNTVFFYAILPVLIIVAAAISWLIVKMHVSFWKRVALSVCGLLAFIGFAVVLLGIYYQLSPTFAGTFRFYVYTAFAPEGDPFEKNSAGYQSTLILRGVANINGNVTVLKHPNPESPTIVNLFTPGKYITADLQGDVLSIPKNEPSSLPRVIQTSLWWALTKNIYSEVSSAQ